MIGIALKRTIALTIAATMLSQVVAPLTAYALTGGPSQPEFGKFEPVGTTDMVNTFTGDFTYNLPVLNIPGPNGGGYALSLSYHSGESGEDESSWVGKGWTLNPGAIMRNRRGYPDDYNGQTIHHYNHTESNWTVSVGPRLGVEAFSKELGASVSMSASYNNYRGYAHTNSYGLDAMGMLDLGYSTTNGEGSWSVAVNPAAIIHRLYAVATKPDLLPDDRKGQYGPTNAEINSIMMQSYAEKVNNVRKNAGLVSANLRHAADYAIGLFGEQVVSSYFPKYSGHSYQFSVGAEVDITGFPVGLEAGFHGSYTYQDNQDEDVHAYGYMYSAGIPADGSMDYYVEKDGAFNKRDRFLGIPFSNADQYVVSGEGVGGSFRLHNRNVGEFRPATKQSSTATTQAGVDVHIGVGVGIGATANLSDHTLSIGGWGSGDDGYGFAPAQNGNDSAFFRFTNDQGGSVTYGSDDRPVRAGHGAPYTFPGGVDKHLNNGKRSGRSSYIGYSTIAEMGDRSLSDCYNALGPSYVRSYNKADSSRHFVGYDDPKIKDGIGEFAVVTPNGQRYVYGLPVYSRNEKELNFVVDGATSPDNYLVYKQRTEGDGGYVVGETRNDPYATAHLLTEITTPDYVDRTNDGPSPDDLGGYTKFNYVRKAGSDKKSDNESGGWYKWRIPYRGLQYHRNSLSDGRDDFGSVVYGEKELYYLSSIETRTHIALFVTSARHDGYPADVSEATATSSPSSTGVDPLHNKMQKLDRIELYAKNTDGSLGKKLSVVHFEYDSSLCKELPNAEYDPHNSGHRLGHLTLKRVYFEYEGVVNARTSPYVFGYQYKTHTDYGDLSSALQTKYDDVIRFGDGLTSSQQNPDYSPFALDPWGHYRYGGAIRAANFEPWVKQKKDVEFDPAAWELKWIKLPSGGEIHIQYEQNDYRYVQDRPVMAMMSLRSTGDEDDNGGTTDIHPDLVKYGITDPGEIMRLAQTINNMVGSDERFYFKFLYALAGEEANLVNCRSEFITGYVKITGASINVSDPTDLIIHLMTPGNGTDPATHYAHPQDVAWNFVATNRAGNLDNYGSCDPHVQPIAHDEKGAAEKMWELAGRFAERFFVPANHCKKIDLAHSYIRLPLNKTKVGGGVRVRRVLTYDKGIESGAAALYGTEYIYKQEDGVTSSGVATNEPEGAREENPLVTFYQKRSDQGIVNRALSGEDKEQFEAPFGESILPPPSVGYSRVVARSIHSGKTSTGYAVNEYFTAHDYPFDKQYTADGGKDASATATDMLDDDAFPIIATNGLATIRHLNMRRMQGYRFILNNMHGQPKRMAEYGGDPSNGSNDDILVTEQSFTYFEPGESVPMVHELGKTPVMENPGKEMEVVMENRKVDDFTVSGGIAGDLTLSWIFLIPSAFPAFDIDEQILQTHVTTKVIRYPAIVKSTKIFRDGLQHVSQNIGFDPGSGQPILTKTTDGYDNLQLGSSTAPQSGSYYSTAVPAWQPYPALGQLAERERLVIAADNRDLAIEKRYQTEHSLNFIFKGSGAAARSVALLTPGDLVRLLDDASPAGYLGVYYVNKIAGNQVLLLPTYLSNVNTTPLVHVGAVEVLRSARSNQISAQAGSVSTYGVIPTVTEHPAP